MSHGLAITLIVCVSLLIATCVGFIWGVAWATNRLQRHVVSMPSARQIRSWRRERLDIRPAQNRRRG